MQWLTGWIQTDPNRHQSYLELEPQSGLILALHERVQINLDLNPWQLNISHLSNFSETLYPILWFDRHITDLNDPSLKRVLQNVEKPLAYTLLGSSKWVICIAGAIAIVSSVLWIAFGRRVKAKQDGNDALSLTSKFSPAILRNSALKVNSEEWNLPIFYCYYFGRMEEL